MKERKEKRGRNQKGQNKADEDRNKISPKNCKTCLRIYNVINSFYKRCPSRQHKKERVVSSISLKSGQKSILSFNIKAFTDEEKRETSKGKLTTVHIKH